MFRLFKGSTIERLEATSSKSRSDIIKECRKSCAKTKNQLLMGEPKKEKTPQRPAEIPTSSSE